MIRQLSAFLFALLVSAAHAAIPIQDVYPTQVAPGGLLQVSVAPQENMSCLATGTPLRIWIGSHAYPVSCEAQAKIWFLVMTLPNDQEVASLPQEGPQGLLVLSAGARPAGPVKASNRRVEILPRVRNVLSIRLPAPDDKYSPQRPAELFDPPLNRTDSRRLNAAREAVKQSLRDSSELTQSVGNLPGSASDGICGRQLFTIALPGNDLQNNVGLLIEQAERRYPSSGIVIAPDTGKQPPADPTHWSQLPKATINRYGWTSIRLATPLPPAQTQTVPTVFLIDTYNPQLTPPDTYAGTRTFNNAPLPFTGHGIHVNELITLVSHPSNPVNMIYRQVCSADGTCRIADILSGLCEAAEASQSERVIVNLSVATPYDHPLLKAAVQAAVKKGAAVVTAYGNNDRCSDREGGPLNFCNAYPADWSGDVPSLYAVGASQQQNSTPQTFQRGQARWTRTGSVAQLVQPPMQVATTPSLMAPGFFYLPMVDMRGTPTPDATPFWGTSFATPLVTGALVRWAQRCPERWPRAQELRRDPVQDPRLDLSRLPTCP